MSSPALDAPIYLISKEIVTHGALFETLCAAVPAPTSIIAAKYPP